ncbi:MAG: hypothetical protein UY05_C0063G0006 [Candidatus Peregrinibacteria bacterium GW2011_GWA2_47_7]|nr:MAG: hypothetical protein UY05_C0063G0006 [Candidatus Peregrinibacteria bacterium GW2011_GWA2_47_7]
MKQKTFLTVVGIIFSVIAGLHLLRLFFRWEAVINNWSVPLWVSIVGVIVAGFLGYQGFRHSK